jgi:Tat protein secretion system quality control protein TatD with DNase activity
VPHVAAKLAELHGVSVERIAEQTSTNFARLFNVM